LSDIDLALQFDPLTCAWQSLGESGQAKNKERENDILDLLAETGKAQAVSIAKTLGKDYSNTHKLLASLWTAGKIKKEMIEGKTFYFLPQE
jgi:DNA-binding MarR family transcriptional regulator